MTMASNEASDWTEEGSQEMCGQKWSSPHSSGTKIPKANAQIHASTNTFILTVKTGTNIPQANAQIYPWTNTFTVKTNHFFLIPTTQHGMQQ